MNEPRHQHHGTKLSKKGQSKTCSVCKLKGHNKASYLRLVSNPIHIFTYFYQSKKKSSLIFSLNTAFTCLLYLFLCFINKSNSTTTPIETFTARSSKIESFGWEEGNANVQKKAWDQLLDVGHMYLFYKLDV